MRRQSPFQLLGNRLKLLREHRHESVAEVSGAVEIEPDVLERIEQGMERPSEDILMLLINYFHVQDSEAVQLWESAGYDHDGEDIKPHSFMDAQTKTAVVLLALDVRALYSDSMTITENPTGLIMNFTQATQQDPALPVARIGMSYEQAEEALRTLGQALLHHKYLSGPKRLPAPGDATNPGETPKDQKS